MTPPRPGLHRRQAADVPDVPGARTVEESSTKADAIRAIYRAVDAPDWAAPNLDALADVLRDLSWLPPGRSSWCGRRRPATAMQRSTSSAEWPPRRPTRNVP